LNFKFDLDGEVSLNDFCKDIFIEMYNEACQLVIAYKVYRCWVSEFTSQPDLDTKANTVAIESIKLENEGWERDLNGQNAFDIIFIKNYKISNILQLCN
jgi:phage tail-like protein